MHYVRALVVDSTTTRTLTIAAVTLTRVTTVTVTVRNPTGTTTTTVFIVISPSCSQPNAVMSGSLAFGHTTSSSTVKHTQLVENQSLLRSKMNTAPIFVLGALLGVSVLLLVVVITGWVCTYFIHKRNSQAKSPHVQSR